MIDEHSTKHVSPSPNKSILGTLLLLVSAMHPESEWLGHVSFSDLVFYAVASGRLALHNILTGLVEPFKVIEAHLPL